MPHIAVGVDAGGTKISLAYAKDAEEPRMLSAPGVNATVEGAQRAGASVADLVERALDGAMPDAIFVGAAGAGNPTVANEIRETLQNRFASAHVAVRDDAHIALRCAVPAGDGAVLIAGTGSIAYAERGNGSYRCGGFGPLVGDEGSGFSIGAAAVKHLLRVYDGRARADALSDDIAGELGVSSAAETVARVYGAPRPAAALAELAPIVLRLGGAGERAASKILQAASLDLAELVKAVVVRAGLSGSGAPIVFSGGMLGSNSLLTYLLETRLINELGSMPIVKDHPAPCIGALRAAQQL
jgi:glucosamine kinase